MTHEATTDISAIPELARLVDQVTQTRRPQALQHAGRTVALLVPATQPSRRRTTTTLVDTSALPPVPYRTVDELMASRPGPVPRAFTDDEIGDALEEDRVARWRRKSS
jgi:hypothetical protein